MSDGERCIEDASAQLTAALAEHPLARAALEAMPEYERAELLEPVLSAREDLRPKRIRQLIAAVEAKETGC
jgi:alkylhydroperoxidase family enzyme